MKKITNEEMREELKRRFPWLNTEEDGNGSDTVDAVCEWFDELGDSDDEEEFHEDTPSLEDRGMTLGSYQS